MDKALLFKLILVGDTGVGKTSLIKTFISDDNKKINKIDRSIGVEYVTKNFQINNDKFSKVVKLEIGYQIINKGVQGILLVFDINQYKTFFELKTWIKEIKLSSTGKEIKYLICNKIDLREPEVKIEEIESFAKKNDITIVQLSAHKKDQVDKMFESLVLDIIESMDDDNLKNRADTIKLEVKNVEENKGGVGFKLGKYFKRNNYNTSHKCC